MTLYTHLHREDIVWSTSNSKNTRSVLFSLNVGYVICKMQLFLSRYNKKTVILKCLFYTQASIIVQRIYKFVIKHVNVSLCKEMETWAPNGYVIYQYSRNQGKALLSIFFIFAELSLKSSNIILFHVINVREIWNVKLSFCVVFTSFVNHVNQIVNFLLQILNIRNFLWTMQTTMPTYSKPEPSFSLNITHGV